MMHYEHMAFTAFQNSDWFGTYGLRKIAVFLPKNSLSNENSNAGDTRFEDVPVIIGQPNLVSSFFRTFSRGS